MGTALRAYPVIAEGESGPEECPGWVESHGDGGNGSGGSDEGCGVCENVPLLYGVVVRSTE